MTINHIKSTPDKTGVKKQILTRQEAKERLIELGWTYQTAAPVLGLKAYESLYRILKGTFQNKRVLRAIAELGPSGRRRYERGGKTDRTTNQEEGSGT
jgi:hypothetical protein